MGLCYKISYPYNYRNNRRNYCGRRRNCGEKRDGLFGYNINQFGSHLIDLANHFEGLSNKCGQLMKTSNNLNFVRQVDVKLFNENQITVKVVGNEVLVNAKHEEKKDEFGFVSRSFSRRYKIPDEYHVEKVRCSLKPNGILLISAPRKVDKQNENKSREIPVIHENCVQSAAANSTVEEENQFEIIDNEKNEKMVTESNDRIIRIIT